MAEPLPKLPLTKREVLDRYFLEHRAKLIDLAAFLDRLDRAQGDADFRADALRQALALLNDGQADRARRILESLSDPSTEPLPASPGQAAVGAPPLAKP